MIGEIDQQPVEGLHLDRVVTFIDLADHRDPLVDGEQRLLLRVEQNPDVESSDDEENSEAYDFWVFAIAIAGAIAGYVAGSELGFTLWPSLGFALVGLIVFGSIAYRFRKIIAIVGAILIVIAIIAGIVEGILTA